MQESNESQIQISDSDRPALTKIEDNFNDDEMIKVQIKEKLNYKFFKVCESGDIQKVRCMMNKKLSQDRRPHINYKYLHNYTVLHVSITNSKILLFRTL